MKLWILKTKKAFDYDTFDAHVVRAEDEVKARALCPTGSEGKDHWMDCLQSTCEELTPDGEAEAVLSSFNAG